jgi:hypothetical protein
LNFHAAHDALPVDIARAILAAALTDEGADAEEARLDRDIGFHGAGEVEAD